MGLGFAASIPIPSVANSSAASPPTSSPRALDYAIAHSWLELPESGTFVRFTQADAAVFA